MQKSDSNVPESAVRVEERGNSIAPDNLLAEAIFRTLLYGDIFSFPMTLPEIHHFLIGVPASLEAVENALATSHWLSPLINCVDGYYGIAGHESFAALRRERELDSQAQWIAARRWGVILAHLPFIRLVALTGALAVHNASRRHDDIDYLLVTAPGRVWLARAFAVMMVRVGRLFGVELCPNYVLAETALLQTRQDIFMAHEIAQMIPLTGTALYHEMRAANRWMVAWLPNAISPFYEETAQTPHGIGHLFQRSCEWLLGGPLGNWLEQWEQRRKLRKFERMAQQANASAQLDSEHVKGHFNDYGYPTLQEYERRLAQYGLTTPLQ